MTLEEQRVAIAETQGWTNLQWREGKSLNKIDRLHGDKGNLKDCRVPVYPEDLNAMHDAEASIKDYSVAVYQTHLTAIKKRGCRVCEWALHASDNLWHATAAQRAEAFLRTLGKWKDA